MIRRELICPNCRNKGPKLKIGRPEPKLPKSAVVHVEFSCGECGRFCAWRSWHFGLFQLDDTAKPSGKPSQMLKPGETATFEGSYEPGTTAELRWNLGGTKDLDKRLEDFGI